MLLHCPRVQVLLPQDKILLEHDGPAWMHWNEHGGTLILKVGDLKFREATGTGEETGFFLLIELSPSENLIHKIEHFAAKHKLTLVPPVPPEPEFSARPILAACHIPAKKMFIFAEESQMQVRPLSGGTMEMQVRGAFRTRAVPCQEADLVMHLTPRDLARLLSYLRTVALPPA